MSKYSKVEGHIDLVREESSNDPTGDKSRMKASGKCARSEPNL